MAARSALAIGLSRRSVGVVQGTLGPRTVQVRHHLQTTIPDEVDAEDPEALGRWLGATLRENDIPAGKATVALARDQLGVKRLVLPTVDPVELPEMVRLSMQRELPFDAVDAVIDFLPIDQSESATTVIAVAMPGEALAFIRRVMRVAKIPVERVTPRAMGIGALLLGATSNDADHQLAIDVVGDSIEFAVAVDGRVQFSRAAELGEVTIGAVVTETRRTWMSYRIVESSSDVQCATALGPVDVAGGAAREIGDLLKVPAQRLGAHARIDTASVGDLDQAWPLAGLLLQPILGRDVINLLEPRHAPDVGARRRQLVLGVVGIVIVVIAGLGMLGMLELKRLDRQIASMTSQARTAQPMRLRVKRDELKLKHLEQWGSVQVDWLAHVEQLVGYTPDTRTLVLDGWVGTLDFRGVVYARRAKEWSAPYTMRIKVEGEAIDRATADAYRDSLVETDVYRTSSSGADTAGGKRLQHGFTYTLHTDDTQPAEAAASSPPAGETKVARGPDGRQP